MRISAWSSDVCSSDLSTIGSVDLAGPAVAVWNYGALSFENSGVVTASPTDGLASTLYANSVDVANTGTFEGGLQAYAGISQEGTPGTVSLANSGTKIGRAHV